jgi:hypothetical protein
MLELVVEMHVMGVAFVWYSLVGMVWLVDWG